VAIKHLMGSLSLEDQITENYINATKHIVGRNEDQISKKNGVNAPFSQERTTFQDNIEFPLYCLEPSTFFFESLP
jgi:hypothetical protein